jgi:hypothetical protein
MRYQDAFGYADAFDADASGGGSAGFNDAGYGNARSTNARSTNARYNDPRYSTGEQRPPWDYEDHGDSRASDFASGGHRASDFPTQTDGFRAQAGGSRARTGSFAAQAGSSRPRTGGFAAQAGSFAAQADGFRARTGDFPTQTDGIPAARPTIDGSLYGAAEESGSVGRTIWGLLTGAVSGFLAAGTALGVANLAAAFVRPQASPIVAIGGVLMAHTPSALENFTAEKLGQNDMATLLLSMYFTIAVIALVIGMIAWRQLPAGVMGIGLFGLVGAYIAYTRPGSHSTDVIPSVVGSLAGITVLVALTSWTRVRQRSAGARDVVGPLATERSGWAV